MSTAEELSQSHNGIGGSSPVLNADNINNTRHEQPVLGKTSLMNSQDGPRPENEVSTPESNQTNQDVKKNEEKVCTEEKKADDSSANAVAADAVEPTIQKVTVSLLGAQSQLAEKSAENSSGYDKAEEPMDVEQEKEKESKESAVAPETSTAEKGDDESLKEKESEKSAAESEKSAEETKESETEDHPKEEAGAAEEKSPQKKSARKAPASKAKRTKTDSESAATTPKKEKIQPKKIDEEGEEAESASKEDKTPLLEAPLIVEGKRSRQRVERLDSNTLVTPMQREFDVPAGKGSKLGDIEFIDATISKAPTAELKILHRIIYGRVGTTPAEIKKNLRVFCGFDFIEDSKEYERKKRSLDHLVMRDMKSVCKLLGLEVGGRKDELIEAVLHYLVEPVDKGKKVPQTPTTKRKRGSTPSSSSRKRSAGGRRSSRRKAADASGEDEEEEETAEGDEEEGEEEKSEEEPAEEDEPSAKKSRRSKPAAPASPASTSKRGQSSRSAKKAQFPADGDIKAIIKELLKGVNLEEVTMKEMTTKVYDKFPGVDLTSKKDFIKETVKALLSTTD